jgi:uncharacterized protein (TIGR02246 family)
MNHQLEANMKRLIANLLLTLFIYSSFAVAELSKVDLDKERQALLKQDQEGLAAAIEGKDLNRIISFWADDAMVFPPGLPVVIGKNAIRQFVEQSFAIPGFSIRWNTTNVQFSDDGSLAYATGTNVTTYNNPDGKQVTVTGKAVTVWRKDSSGIWRCVIDIWNEDHLNPTATTK